MPDVTLGVDLSDHIVRLVVAGADGRVVSRAETTAAPGALREAVARVVSDASGTLSGVAAATAFPGEAVPNELAAALREAGARGPELVTVAAGTAAVLAEQWCGAARGLRQVIAFSIARHVTAGVLLNGAPWTGAHGLASSIGWMALNPVEREDYRRYGGLEAEISAAGIVRRQVWRIKSGDRSSVADRVGGDFARITAADIFQAARDGDGVSISVVRDTVRYVGMAVANLATVFDPECVVLGGAIAESGDAMRDAITTECGRRMAPGHAARVRFVLSTLGRDAVAIGAARAAARAGA